jgi:putative ABC transport system permease protein
MSILSSLRVALAALLIHKGRSTLTSLGIVIGIGAVIAMVSAGEGAHSLLEDRMQSVGKNLILVRPGSRTEQGMVADFSTLTRTDADAIKRELGPLIVGVAPTQITHRAVSSRNGQTVTSVVGTTADLQPVRRWGLHSGRFLSDDDVTRRAHVCIIGLTTRDRLFPHHPGVIGKTVRIDHLELRIVGVLASKGRSPTGADQDDQIMVPLTTLQQQIVGAERLSVITVTARSEDLIDPVKKEISRILRRRHRVQEGEEDFDVSSVAEMAELAYVVTETMQLLVAVIASLSLLVGGIGIMNIMLVSVTERTREIGIRMAIGATTGNILTQFLIEAVVLSLAGGLLGVMLGLAAAVGLAHLIGWPVVISPAAVLLACGVSAGVGVFFGYYPAWRASRLDPIEALRNE